MIKVCLTGSIATGKTTISKQLADSGAIILDTDLIVHSMYNYPSETSKKILEAFGTDLLQENKIDRKKLSQIVFSDPSKLELLNSIVHPAVKKYVYAEVEKYTDLEKEKNLNYLLVYVIPLFFETNSSYQVDKILLAFCSEENQLKRLIQRENYTQEEAFKRIKAQIPISEKIKKADFLIDTNLDLDSVKGQVSDFLKKFKWDKFYV